ncbi:relaxase/mobilization nuclease [Streptomyces sp. NPDC101181]|uniref:relaxase/mobilization nuclease n=1 Tax=Streptomyces sp. NPDC101181 TaxID=3366125 RepID=UPI00381DF09E
MIPHVNERAHSPSVPLSEALGRSVPIGGGAVEHTVVAHWSGRDSCAPDEAPKSWTAAQWSQHLEKPLLQHPFAASPTNDRRAVFHLVVRLHPDDRDLSAAEWTETALRLARAAGIEIPGDAHGCRWAAVRGRPGRLDLIANLIRLDGAWQSQPDDLMRRLCDEARHIEHDLRLSLTRDGTAQPNSAQAVMPTSSARFATILAQLADEASGPLAATRRIIEQTAHHVGCRPGTENLGTARWLELIARRLHHIEEDLNATVTPVRRAAGG